MRAGRCIEIRWRMGGKKRIEISIVKIAHRLFPLLQAAGTWTRGRSRHDIRKP